MDRPSLKQKPPEDWKDVPQVRRKKGEGGQYARYSEQGGGSLDSLSRLWHNDQ